MCFLIIDRTAFFVMYGKRKQLLYTNYQTLRVCAQCEKLFLFSRFAKEFHASFVTSHSTTSFVASKIFSAIPRTNVSSSALPAPPWLTMTSACPSYVPTFPSRCPRRSSTWSSIHPSATFTVPSSPRYPGSSGYMRRNSAKCSPEIVGFLKKEPAVPSTFQSGNLRERISHTAVRISPSVGAYFSERPSFHNARSR